MKYLYVCEVCERMSNDEIEIGACEEYHRIIEKLKVKVHRLTAERWSDAAIQDLYNCAMDVNDEILAENRERSKESLRSY